MRPVVFQPCGNANTFAIARKSFKKLKRESGIDVQIIGSDSGLRCVMERTALVAPLDVPVLLLGDTGTGKEVISRAIHLRSARANGPFVRVNCGAIPSELIDSLLFGHERGSFTGASEDRQGWFERANGGTLFLDEIGELTLPAQVRLLRVLQDHQIERVGGRSVVDVNVRIIAATHRDLAAMVSDKTFREDLWFRINVFPILLPRLRDRPQDIPELARHFARRAAERFGLSYVGPTDRDLQMLAEYSWPGNIRELHAVIDRAAILGNGASLEIATALGVNPRTAQTRLRESSRQSQTARVESTNSTNPPAVWETLDQAMRRHIEQTLEKTRGQIEGKNGAAAILDINPHTLRARMRKLKVNWKHYRNN